MYNAAASHRVGCGFLIYILIVFSSMAAYIFVRTDWKACKISFFAMMASMVKVNIKTILNFSGAEVNLQSVFDTISPKILPMLLTLGCYWLLQKKVSGTKIMLGLLLLGILGVAVGLL